MLALRGSFKKNPDRGRARDDEPVPDGDIGEPPEWLSAERASCWREIVSLAHAGTLSRGDRLIVEHGAQLLSQLRADDWQVHPTLLIRWEGFLSKLGMTPADRSKVAVKVRPKDHADPLDEFAGDGSVTSIGAPRPPPAGTQARTGQRRKS